MNDNQLDQMIQYIEKNLTEPVDYLKLARMVGIPPYILQRVFHFITGMTIMEYIRKRRLSKAYEFLSKGEKTVTELAFLYCYSSSSSFSRAFKKYFGISPKKVRKSKKVMSFPKIVFKENLISEDFFSYQILNLEEVTLYGKKCEIDDENYVSQIYQLYSFLEQEQLLQRFKKEVWYGITIVEKDKTYYFVGSDKKYPNLEKYRIPKSKYILVDVMSAKQKDIVSTEIKMFQSFLPSTDYQYQEESSLYELEIYNRENCSVALPIY